MSEKKRRPRRYPRGARGVPRRFGMLRKSRHMQRWFLRNPWMKPMLSFLLAAVKIQALARGYIVRKLGAKQWRKRIYKKKKVQPTQLNRYLANLDFYSRSKRRKPVYLDDGYSTWCAVRIQAWWRMVPVRRRFFHYVKDFYQIGSIQIQNTWRLYAAARQKTLPPEPTRGLIIGKLPRTKVGHARAIQLAWRTHCSIRVYRYFRDLILHKLKGAPNDLLRCIIPGEADILDKASGVHVRFRLGGHIFPPKIYYKIFTHRPLCDVNAFAPRNYANESLQEPSSLHLNPQRRDQPLYKGTKEKYTVISTHMRVGGALYDATINTNGGTKNWYKRDDCNYWRPISHESSDDPMFEMPYQSMSRTESTFNSKKIKKSHYHFSRIKRKEDILRERKKKKRDWMLKAYMFSAGTKGQDFGEESASCETPISSRPKPLEREEQSTNTSCVMDMYMETQTRRDVPSIPISQQLIMTDSCSEATSAREDRFDEVKFQGPPDSIPGGCYARVQMAEVVEDEDLLKWSQALDYELYNSDWANMAVSMPSDYNYSNIYNATTNPPKKNIQVVVDH